MHVLIYGSRLWNPAGLRQDARSLALNSPERDALLYRAGQLEAIMRGAFILHVPAGSLVIHGAAIGADSQSVFILEELYGPGEVEFKSYPVTNADWAMYGKSAGPRRNRIMGRVLLELPEPRLALGFRVYGPSRGTDNMTGIARELHIPGFIYDEAGEVEVL